MREDNRMSDNVPESIRDKATDLLNAVKGEDGWTIFLVVGRQEEEEEIVEFSSAIVTETTDEGMDYLPWPLAVLAELHNDRAAMEKMADYLEQQRRLLMQVAEAEDVAKKGGLH